MNPYNWINNFRNELAGQEVNNTIFSLMLANKFNGEVLVKLEEYDILDIVVLIENNLYDINGEIDPDEIEASEYIMFDKLSLLHYTSAYQQAKWWFFKELDI